MARSLAVAFGIISFLFVNLLVPLVCPILELAATPLCLARLSHKFRRAWLDYCTASGREGRTCKSGFKDRRGPFEEEVMWMNVEVT